MGRDATVLDAYIAEFSPHHKLLWSWDSAHHIGLDESRRWLAGLEYTSLAAGAEEEIRLCVQMLLQGDYAGAVSR